MKILMIDSDRAEGAVLADEFRVRGHDVVRCFPNEDDGVCVGVHDQTSCPIDSLGCDVALVVRDGDGPVRFHEMGAVCAVRRHIPLVEAYGHGDGPFAEWATPTGTAVVEAVEEFDAGLRPRLVEAVEKALSDLPVVARLGRLPTIAIRATGERLSLSIGMPNGVTPADEHAIVTWAVRAVRANDPHSSAADVIVTGGERRL